jgi:hexokinase
VVIKMLVNAIGKRAARLSAVALGAVMILTEKLKTDDVVDIGVDGSLVEFYPGFEDMIREAFREIEGIGEEGEKKIRIGIAKDGSGVGAALIALVGGEALKKARAS